MTRDADGQERTVHWRDYPGIAGVDVQEMLSGPTPEEGLAAGESMIADIRADLTLELQLHWASVPNEKPAEALLGRSQNYFGGKSLLTGVSSPPSPSTSVPKAWVDKQVIRSALSVPQGDYLLEKIMWDGSAVVLLSWVITCQLINWSPDDNSATSRTFERDAAHILFRSGVE